MSNTALGYRYAGLLSFYPASYLAEHGDEMIDTYVNTVPPGRNWPRPADAVDAVAGGLRQQLRQRHAGALADLAGPAGVLALVTGVALASFWLLRHEVTPVPEDDSGFGPFRSVAALAWMSWLVGAGAFALGRGVSTRWAVGLAALLTIVAPWGRTALLRLSGSFDDSVYFDALSWDIVVPTVVLAAVVLLVPNRPDARVRWLPLAAVATPELLRRFGSGGRPVAYYDAGSAVLESAGVVLLVVVVVATAALAFRRDARALWVPCLAVLPVGLLLTPSALRAVFDVSPYGELPKTWLGVGSLLTALVSVVVLWAAIAVAGRRGFAKPLRSATG